jgi:EAL domain-containing protein (putative c-di-GMP-specific phosphodiesterase class I)
VNLSIQQIKNSNIVETVKNVLKDSGLEPKYLELEITESSLYSRDRMKEILLELKKLGVFLSVDDFGTGYSSLSYLRDFPIDAIKIDRAFLERVPEEKNSAEIVKAIISFAQILELKVVAEGVETDAQLAFLKEKGCDEIQGYIFSPPLSSKEFENLMKGLQNQFKGEYLVFS